MNDFDFLLIDLLEVMRESYGGLNPLDVSNFFPISTSHFHFTTSEDSRTDLPFALDPAIESEIQSTVACMEAAGKCEEPPNRDRDQEFWDRVQFNLGSEKLDEVAADAYSNLPTCDANQNEVKFNADSDAQPEQMNSGSLPVRQHTWDFDDDPNHAKLGKNVKSVDSIMLGCSDDYIRRIEEEEVELSLAIAASLAESSNERAAAIEVSESTYCSVEELEIIQAIEASLGYSYPSVPFGGTANSSGTPASCQLETGEDEPKAKKAKLRVSRHVLDDDLIRRRCCGSPQMEIKHLSLTDSLNTPEESRPHFLPIDSFGGPDRRLSIATEKDETDENNNEAKQQPSGNPPAEIEKFFMAAALLLQHYFYQEQRQSLVLNGGPARNEAIKRLQDPTLTCLLGGVLEMDFGYNMGLAFQFLMYLFLFDQKIYVSYFGVDGNGKRTAAVRFGYNQQAM